MYWRLTLDYPIFRNDADWRYDFRNIFHIQRFSKHRSSAYFRQNWRIQYFNTLNLLGKKNRFQLAKNNAWKSPKLKKNVRLILH